MNQILAHPTPAEKALQLAFAAQEPARSQTARFAEFNKTGLPHPRAENWRWTDLHAGIRNVLEGAQSTETTEGTVKLASAASVPFIGQSTDPISLLAAALSTDNNRQGFAITQTPNATLYLNTDNQSSLCGSQVSIEIASGCQVILVENNTHADSGLSVDWRSFRIAPGASLTRILVNPNQMQQTRINHTEVEIGEGGQYQQFILDFGARMSRIETHIRATGSGTNVLLNGAYLLQGEARADSTSLIRHDYVEAKTRQLIKGVVLDQAQAVFQGKFHVAREGQQTDAKMGHHALLLSDNAKVQAKPDLEIYADDVACAHGNTTGALDESALFYMRQRGLPEVQARALLIRAFVCEVLDALPETDLANELGAQIDNWLEQHI